MAENYERQRKYRDNNPAQRILRVVRARDEDTDLDVEWIELQIAKGHCSASNIPFQIKTSGEYHANPWQPSVDRLDPTKGYTKRNCRMVCLIYNLARNQFRDADVMTLADALVSRRNARIKK